MTTIPWVLLALVPCVDDSEVRARLVAALEQNLAPLAYFSCRVEFERLGQQGQGYYVRTPDYVQAYHQTATQVKALKITATERWNLYVDDQVRLRSGHRRAASRWKDDPLLNYADAWFLALGLASPELTMVYLPEAMPLLDREKYTFTIDSATGDIVMHNRRQDKEEQGTSKAVFARQYNYMRVYSEGKGTNTGLGYTTESESHTSDFVELAPGAFFPFSKRSELRMISTKEPGVVKTIISWTKLSEVSIKPEDALRYPMFRIPEGIEVYDEIEQEIYRFDAHGNKHPVIGSNGRPKRMASWEPTQRDEAQLLDQIPQVAEGSRLGPTAVQPPTRGPWYFIGATVVLLLFSAAYWIWRRRGLET